jgi:O-antigen/teichoic acid export membrane protein
MVGNILSTVIVAGIVIFVARVVGAQTYGEYTIALIPASIAMLVQDLGIFTALTRFTALYHYDGREADLRGVVRTGLIFIATLSAVLSLAIYASSDLIASMFLRRPDLDYLVKAVSFSVFGNGLWNAALSVFVGYEMMGLRSLVQIIAAVTKGVMMLLLVLMGLGAFGAVLAHSTSYLFGGFFGVLFILIFIKFKSTTGTISGRDTLHIMLAYGLPIYAGSLVSGGLTQWYNSLMTLNVPIDIIGNYGAAINFGALVSFVTLPIGIALFPLFSKTKRGDPQLRRLFDTTVKYTTMVTIPVVLLLILLSSHLINVVYGSGYPYTAIYLSLYLINFAFEGLGGTPLSYLILGLGESRVSFLSSAVTFIVGAPLAFILIPRFQIYGLLATLIIAPRVGWIYTMLWMRRNLGFTINWKSSTRIYASSFLALLAGYATINLLNLGDWATLIFGSVIFLVVYLIALPICRAINSDDIVELNEVAEVIGPLAPIFKSALSLLRRLL